MSEERAPYFTKKDHLFCLIGPSGSGKKEVAKALFDMGYSVIVADAIAKRPLPEDLITVIYLNASEGTRYSRMAYRQQLMPSDIRTRNMIEAKEFIKVKTDFIVDANGELDDVVNVVKEIIDAIQEDF